jgi:hypothetical protein
MSYFTVKQDVDFDEIPENLLQEWAEDNGYYKYAVDFDDEELIEALELSGHTISSSRHFYPNNSIRINDAYNTLLDNIESVPVEVIEKIIADYNLL